MTAMHYRTLDLCASPRAAHFAYFSAMANPYVGVTVETDITAFMKTRKHAGLPFFLSFVYCVGRAANAVPEHRQRTLNGSVVEFDACDTSHTVLRDDGAYSYCRLNCTQPFERFLPEAMARNEAAKAQANLDDGEDGVSLLFLSSLPWLHYSALQQPVPTPADSNPRITWGQYATADGRTTLPVTLLANHALVDGVHLGRFYDALRDELHSFARENETL